MKKKIIALFMIVTLIITMAIPTMAEYGENMGNDNFSVNVVLDSLEGDYSLGEYKEITLDIWASSAAGTTVERKFEIVGLGEGTDFSNLEFKDGETWKPINEYNGIIELQNDKDRTIRVKFNTAGVYSVKLSLLKTSGEEIDSAERIVDVSDEGIKAYEEPETTPSAPTTEPETTPSAPTTEPETTPSVSTTEPETTPSVSTTEPETTPSVSTTEPETSTGPTICPTTSTVSETTEPKTSNVTTYPVTPTTGKAKKPGQVKIKKVNSKKKSAKKVKLSLKKVNGANGYQIAVYKTKKNANKNKKAIVKKFVKKTIVTVKSNKLKNKKILYVRARAYVLDDKTKAYGKWSTVKKVKIK